MARRFSAKAEEVVYVLMVDAYVLMDSSETSSSLRLQWKNKYKELLALVAKKDAKRAKKLEDAQREKEQEELERQKFLDTTYECGKPQVGWSPDAREFCQDCWDDWRTKGFAVRSMPAEGGTCTQRFPKVPDELVPPEAG